MNRVSNKDFEAESSLNSALSIFSDVFRPASRMQSTQTFGSGSLNMAPVMPEISHEQVCTSPGRTI